MDNYIMKFVNGKHFIEGLNDDYTADRVVHIDGLKLNEFESIIELVAMQTYKKYLVDNRDLINKSDVPIVNCYIYDGNGSFICGREVNIIGDDIRTIKYTRDMLEILGIFGKHR